MSKVTYSDVAAELRVTSQLCMDTYATYSYVTGTYESIIAGLVADLPKHKQAEVMRSLRQARERMEKDA
jgi:hypothetical protein